MRQYFTAESVTSGHPDKLCDQISDAILDELLSKDPMSRCACEVTAEPGAVHIMGEVTSRARVDYEAVARGVIRDVGYTDAASGFSDACAVSCSLHRQSPDIALGVDRSLEAKTGGGEDLGAGDQGMMFGFACDETPEGMPLGIVLAHALTRRLETARRDGTLPYLRPDGKAQVTVEYRDGAPARLETVVVSAQHAPDADMDTLRRDILEHVVRASIPARWLDGKTRFFINPTGRFVSGGPAADTGLTGRKIMVDTYGSYARHGGGAFSGKDPTKVDRTAAYMARHIALTIVAAGAAKRCEIQLGYAIGVARPVSVMVDTSGTGRCADEKLTAWVRQIFDLRPAAMIEYL
ncbi:MAG TPA: methionine adenosyltransferase, partial [Oscillospiraceae bacterium]|nr:methionine adenosyltransferase [Oscillospiraceae bacterium]